MFDLIFEWKIKLIPYYVIEFVLEFLNNIEHKSNY